MKNHKKLFFYYPENGGSRSARNVSALRLYVVIHQPADSWLPVIFSWLHW